MNCMPGQVRSGCRVYIRPHGRSVDESPDRWFVIRKFTRRVWRLERRKGCPAHASIRRPDGPIQQGPDHRYFVSCSLTTVTVVVPGTAPACVPAPGVVGVIIIVLDASKIIGAHPVSHLFANRRADFPGIPIVHATVHACVDDLGAEIVRLFKDVRGTRDRTVECEVDHRQELQELGLEPAGRV